MSAPRERGALPGHHELAAVCAALGLDYSGARMLLSRSNAVFHLPAVDVVVRLSQATPTNDARAARVVCLTRWIADHGGPALAPTSHPQPVREAGTVATVAATRACQDLLRGAGTRLHLHAATRVGNREPG
ncbi:MAG: hypothetical protein ACRDRT_11920, partial [Pseudonocardiaceae bacterium]